MLTFARPSPIINNICSRNYSIIWFTRHKTLRELISLFFVTHRTGNCRGKIRYKPKKIRPPHYYCALLSIKNSLHLIDHCTYLNLYKKPAFNKPILSLMRICTTMMVNKAVKNTQEFQLPCMLILWTTNMTRACDVVSMGTARDVEDLCPRQFFERSCLLRLHLPPCWSLRFPQALRCHSKRSEKSSSRS